MLATQCVEKWVLQKLTFVIAHDIFRVQEFVKLDDTTALSSNFEMCGLILAAKGILRTLQLNAHWGTDQIKLLANPAF